MTESKKNGDVDSADEVESVPSKQADVEPPVVAAPSPPLPQPPAAPKRDTGDRVAKQPAVSLEDAYRPTDPGGAYGDTRPPPGFGSHAPQEVPVAARVVGAKDEVSQAPRTWASGEVPQAAATDVEAAPGAVSVQSVPGGTGPVAWFRRWLARRQRAAEVSQTSAVVGMMIVTSLVMVLWNLQDASLENANTGSRYATIESLVDYGTYHIDKSRYRGTIDKKKVGKHFISSKPPALPTYAAGTYWVFQKLTGKTIAKNEGAVVWFVSLCTGWLAHLIFLIYLYRLSKLLLQRQLAIIGTVAVGCFAYLGVAYATAINNHSIGASIALVGLYYAYRVRRGHDAGLRHWVYSGLCFGFLTAVDLPSGALMAAALVYLGLHDWRKTLLLFCPALLPGLAAQVLINYHITGSLTPAYDNPELKNFAGNYFRTRRSGIDALDEPKHVYAFHVLLGHHGLFSMTPLYVFSLWELIRSLRKRALRPEALVIGVTCLVITAFYIYRTRNYGGWCVGMRHLVPIMPLLLLYFGLWLDRVRLTRTVFASVLVAFSVSAFHVQDGLGSPFQFSVWHNWLENSPNRARIGKTFNLPKKTSKPKTKKRTQSAAAKKAAAKRKAEARKRAEQRKAKAKREARKKKKAVERANARKTEDSKSPADATTRRNDEGTEKKSPAKPESAKPELGKPAPDRGE